MKHVTDSERIATATLNRKYMELEEKDKQIKQLTRELDVLKSQLKEDKETISQLCKQVSYLSIKVRQ
jgi:predicted RNase H-like nuclease (RuvC/YqgF family)